MDTSKSTTGEASQVPNTFFTTHYSRAFLDIYDNIPNYTNAFVNARRNMFHRNNNSTSQTNLASDQTHQTDPPYIDIYVPSTTQPTCPQWSGTQLAKKQAKQEQKVFAKRQCVRFGSYGDCSASSNDYGDEDEMDEDDNEEEDTESRQPWQFSQLAKSLETKERKLFKAVAGRWLEAEEGEEEFL